MLLDVLGHLGQNVDEGTDAPLVSSIKYLSTKIAILTAIHIEVSINIILIVIIVN